MIEASAGSSPEGRAARGSSVATSARLPASAVAICPRCETEALYPLAKGPAAPRCPECGFEWREGAVDIDPERPLDRCVFCGRDELYVQKDFNRQLGLGIVLTSFLIVFLVMLLHDHRTGIYLLFVLAAVDFVAYALLRNVAVCYLCQSVYRGLPTNPEHRGFDLGLEEKHKRLRIDWTSQIAERK